MRKLAPWLAIGGGVLASMVLTVYATKTVVQFYERYELPNAETVKDKIIGVIKARPKAAAAAVGAVAVPALVIGLVARNVNTALATSAATTLLATAGVKALEESVSAHVSPDEKERILHSRDAKMEAYQQTMPAYFDRKAPVAIGEGPGIMPEWTGLGNELFKCAFTGRPFYCCEAAVKEAFAQVSVECIRERGTATLNEVYERLNLTPVPAGEAAGWDVSQSGVWEPTVRPDKFDGSAILVMDFDYISLY